MHNYNLYKTLKTVGVQIIMLKHTLSKTMGGLAGNASQAPTPVSAITHTQGRPSFANLPIVWLCKGWPPLCMRDGACNGRGLISISSQVAHSVLTNTQSSMLIFFSCHHYKSMLTDSLSSILSPLQFFCSPTPCQARSHHYILCSPPHSALATILHLALHSRLITTFIINHLLHSSLHSWLTTTFNAHCYISALNTTFRHACTRCQILPWPIFCQACTLHYILHSPLHSTLTTTFCIYQYILNSIYMCST